MMFRKEVYLTRDLNEFERAQNVLADQQIDCTWKSNPITNPGRSHGVPFIDASAAYEYHLYAPAKDREKAERALREAGI